MRRSPRRDTRRGWERWAAGSLGILLLLVCLELGLRVVGMTLHTPRSAVESQALAATCEGCLRVLCVGDSFTYGIGASNGEDYPTHLEAALKSTLARSDVMVFNAGQVAVNSAQVLEIVPAFLDAVRPEVVVLLAGTTNEASFIGYRGDAPRRSALAAVEDHLSGLRIVRLLHIATNVLQGGAFDSWRGLNDQIPADDTASRRLRWMETGGDAPPGRAFREAAALLGAGRPVEAEARFVAMLEANPDDAAACWGMAAAARDRGALDEAERWYRRGLALQPRDPTLHFGLGELGIDRGTLDKASCQAFEEGIAADPGFAANYFGASLCAWQLGGQRGEALEILLACVQQAPLDPVCYRELGGLAHLEGRQQEVAAKLAPLAAISPIAADYIDSLRRQPDREAMLRWVHDDMERAAALVEASGARVVLQSYPFRTDINDVLRQVADERGARFVDQAAAFERALGTGRSREELFAPDGHCSSEGYRLMAQSLAPAIAAPAAP